MNTNLKAINPELLVNNEMFTFIPFKSCMVDQIDVYYQEKRIAILNGIDGAALRWTAKNGSNIPNDVIDSLEKIVIENMQKSTEHLLDKAPKSYEQLMANIFIP